MHNDLYIGLMSGTSADALDAVLVDFKTSCPSILQTCSKPIPETLKRRIYSLALPGNDEINQIRLLDRELAKLSAKAIEELCGASNIPTKAISAIGSHGQTVRHYPPSNKEEYGYTLQVSDPNMIAELTGITTIADFRRRDIAAGGQGAPLVPAFHDSAFRSPDTDRIIINLGGIANITWLPHDGETIGYDTGPANTLMDGWCQKHLQQAYDKNGAWALSGIAEDKLLSILLKHPFLSLPHPKSTGREAFNLVWLEQQLKDYGSLLKAEDIQATLLAFTATTIANAARKHDKNAKADVFVCGGGAQNKALMRTLHDYLGPRKVTTTTTLNIHPNWVECVAFAWMAKQTIYRRKGNLPSATGANKEVVLGAVYY